MNYRLTSALGCGFNRSLAPRERPLKRTFLGRLSMRTFGQFRTIIRVGLPSARPTNATEVHASTQRQMQRTQEVTTTLLQAAVSGFRMLVASEEQLVHQQVGYLNLKLQHRPLR